MKERMAALAYRDDRLVGIETETEWIARTARDWARRGLRVELTTLEDALRTWRAAPPPSQWPVKGTVA